MDENGFLVLEKMARSFGAQRAVADVTLRIGRGEAFSLLGPSGCGKTTLLRLIAGLESPDGGRILLDGEDITALPPEKRPVNTVFQNYALFPHLSVARNIAFGLEMARVPKKAIQTRVDAMLELTRLQDQAAKKPAQLSGGQKQRVAIARALVNEPRVLLLDEPLAALDLKLRQHLLAELRAIHQRVGTTFIYVTHDQGEAMSLSDRVAVMNEGRVEQVDTPRALYDSPANGFVAAFVGDANFFDATLLETTPQGLARVQTDTLGTLWVQNTRELAAQSRVRVMIRPERLHLHHEAAGLMNSFTATVQDSAYFGPHLRHTLSVGGQRILAQQASTEEPPRKGEVVHVSFDPAEARLLAA